MNGYQAELDWLYTTLAAVPSLVTLIDDGHGQPKAYLAGKVPAGTGFPFLTVGVIDQQTATPVGGTPNAYILKVDVSLWGVGTDDSALQTAFDDLDAALNPSHPVLNHGWQIDCGQDRPLPPALPPMQPGEPVTVRLGATYDLFAGAA